MRLRAWQSLRYEVNGVMLGWRGATGIAVVFALLSACGKSSQRGGGGPEAGRGGTGGASAGAGSGGAASGASGRGGGAGKGGASGAQSGDAGEGGASAASGAGGAKNQGGSGGEGADTGGNGGQTGGAAGSGDGGVAGSGTFAGTGGTEAGAAGTAGVSGVVVYRACAINDQAVPRLSLFRADTNNDACVFLSFELYSGGGCTLLDNGNWCLYSARLGSDAGACLTGSAPADGVEASSATGDFTVSSGSVDAHLELQFPEDGASTIVHVDVTDCTSDCNSPNCVE